MAHTGATSRRDELPPSARMLAALDASWCGYMNVTKRSGDLLSRTSLLLSSS
ncbi:hypothetical protein [Streptomyces mexicanus]|uniref:hypothetical protein n=1 Tax=Streptomyces mexicanus TaxID=178566 RepID=UPI00163BECB8|nr:hypothetical protein [Streptomyces mexicanus]